ncbi:MULTISPECIES: cell division protein FtsA [Acetobacter]|uniref:Cell division protein FtsA n=1 Tax=Acetobacter thailandicus TaxID=1502842 RepID=A0ABT3QBF0_9PROT|nr:MULTISPECIES: cell division protein FtsA [Acetobacter]MBS0959195.1 cell division protein FtsA [Acetobacter thailandicus]MBS0984917.1 cell division protein FtsA [Acetobacter thailandicus]MBS1003568.1 cell division protein FtsA [Acetobacter thailandicus]MCX2562622.1 cell division protein FtsA [Acetobacter thailandicus]NHN94688.1 cell division protein FtsA [Acetobacter thailandicus]
MTSLSPSASSGWSLRPKRSSSGLPVNHHSSSLLPPSSDNSKRQKPWRSGYFAVLDIGSTKITCLIGRGESNGILRVVGCGWRRADGIRNGAITDLHKAEAAIRATVGQAERMADRSVDGVVVNLSCGHPASRLYNVRWPIGGRIVSEADIRRIINEGRMQATLEGREVVHTLPIDFTVDDTENVVDPRGHLCDTLKVRLNIIDAASTALLNLQTVLNRSELKLDALVSSPMASGLSVLNADERELGTTVIDMGGGTTSLAVFGEGQLLHTTQIGVGGQHVTRDIARGLSTSLENAERLKTVYGSADLASDVEDDLLTVELLGNDVPHFEQISRSHLGRIIRPRMEETLELVREKLDGAGLGSAASGRIVLTGGGSLLDGIRPLAERILGAPSAKGRHGPAFNRSVRLGRPKNIIDLPEKTAASAGFATAAGLLSWAASAERPFGDVEFRETQPSGFLQKVVAFIREKV